MAIAADLGGHDVDADREQAARSPAATVFMASFTKSVRSL
jgi:hypothetical protein